MKQPIFAWTLALCGFGFGCGGDVGPIGPRVFEIAGATVDGTGYTPFRGGDCALVPGSQGGFHVWLKVRTRGVAAGIATLAYTVRRKGDARLVARNERRIEIGAPNGSGVFELREPIPVFMCPTPIGTRVTDERVLIEATLTAEDGTPLGSASDEAVPRCPSGDQAAFCARICVG
jgi:hypothetical protein